MRDIGDVSLQIVETLDEAFALKRWLGERREILAIDTETGGLDFWSEPLRLVVVGDVDTGWAIPFDLWAGVVHETLGAYEGPVVFHNAKFDLHFLETNGVKIRRDRLHDTQTAAQLIEPLALSGLKPLANKWVDRSMSGNQKTLHDGMEENGWTWRTVPTTFPPYWIYAALDGVLTARLWAKFAPIVRDRFQDVYDLEIATTLVLTDMERRGARVDLAYLDTQIEAADRYIEETRAWVSSAYDGVNPTANRQVAEALVLDGVQLTERTPTGHYKLDEAVLSTVAGHPLADAVLSIRRVGKFRGSYFDALRRRADGDVIHAGMKSIGARTGRMSISNPPLQQMPRTAVVRDAFIPRDGNALISCDFDQIEMRLLAHFANETSMIDAIRDGVDLHSHVARSLFGPDFTKEQRQGCKGVNFGKVYGAGDETMAKTIGCSTEDAARFREMYEAQFPRVNTFMDEVQAVARTRYQEEGEAYVTTPIGRRQPGDTDRLYACVNYLIQGTAGDVFKRALVDLDHAGFGEFLILPVHDEAILDVPADHAEEMAREIERVMTDEKTYQVPLSASADVLPTRWGDKYR